MECIAVHCNEYINMMLFCFDSPPVLQMALHVLNKEQKNSARLGRLFFRANQRSTFRLLINLLQLVLLTFLEMALPPQLKAIQHYLRTAQEHEKRDPVVAYYCEFVLASQLGQLAIIVRLCSAVNSIRGTGTVKSLANCSVNITYEVDSQPAMSFI